MENIINDFKSLIPQNKGEWKIFYFYWGIVLFIFIFGLLK